MTDALTGLGNRRCLDEVLPQWLEQARAGRGCFAFVLVDVDYFKTYNDLYGHLAGDVCLRRIGEALASVTRKEDDLVLRYGGEEFAVLIRGVSEQVALLRANQLLDAVAALAIPHAARPDGAGLTTISAGVTYVRTGARPDLETVVADADAALYAAKRAGRGRVERKVCTDLDPAVCEHATRRVS
nr:GGDEF domain-containing protein [Jiella mangrovi]